MSLFESAQRWGQEGPCFDYRAVRGPKTREVFLKHGCNVPEVYGDPALLFPYVYKPKKCTLPTADLCLVPHMHDLADEFSWWKENNGTSLSSRFDYFDHTSTSGKSNATTLLRVIDIRTPNAAAFIDTLATCKLVASASLHGMILAEAYNITYSWIQLSKKKEGNFKYKDFFLSVGINTTDATVSGLS